MLEVKLNPGDSIESAIKKLKNKVVKTKLMTQLRDRKTHQKKSDKKREQIKKAQYLQNKRDNENN
jgi:small subunit ribosomal protein S21